MAARRESMIFYASWWDGIKELPVAVRNEVLNTIVEYGIEGVMTSEQGQMTKAIMALIRPQIDANNVRWENGCKGGAPVGNQNARKNNQETTEKQAKTTYNENEYVNVNVNENESECECDAHAPALTREEEIFKKFLEWCRYSAPDSLLFAEPLSLEQFTQLYTKYGGDRVKQCAKDMHSKGAYKRNKNALTCWEKWIVKT